ncbi:interleukin-13 receptor subunit alpha-2 [Nerophis lumbriciformis]|uniref:interleukin-13 receptor subunit alpha-2 n=1 Tax=Nerophis lumbriciformis TaxID=546530 RepID=UPI002AE08349|nr:interleukin-13 receptor subunit alpha-2-like [Nerophis lumbriciformis]
MQVKMLTASKEMLLLTFCMMEVHCSGIQVDPPEEIQLIDRGHLGYLEITWSLPVSLIDMQECPIRYQLEYYNIRVQKWTVIKTIHRTYSDQFDLTKDIRVIVYTLLGGHCTNNTWVRSANYTELVQNLQSTGLQSSGVKNIRCVFYNMENMICEWKRNITSPSSLQLYLYYWHSELEKTEECPDYIATNGVRSGCNFTRRPLPLFTDVNLCVNGSSPKGPLKPTYASIQIQNFVKPDPADKPHLLSHTPLKLTWNKPYGKVPEHCLEYELEHIRVNPGGQYESERISTMLTSQTFPTSGEERNCFKVRCKLHTYCAEESFWSKWSDQTCYGTKKGTRMKKKHEKH